MPLGSSHLEIGLLLRHRGWFILQREDGGRGRLEADRQLEPLLGRRVRIEGVRSDFDVLEVIHASRC